MNVQFIAAAIELLDDAIDMTPQAVERKEIQEANDKLRAVLRKRGVFIGERDKEEGGS